MKLFVLNGRGYERALDGLFDEVVHDPNQFFKNPRSFNLIMFSGGEDVCPWLYDDESPRNFCYYNQERDEQEVKVFLTAEENRIPMTGICRGLQFLNVMAGGKLMHHITGHENVAHMISTSEGVSFEVNSFHHQMCLPAPKSSIIGWSTRNLSREYIGEDDNPQEYEGPEIEAMILPTIRAAGVQFHPEWMPKSSFGYGWYLNLVKYLLRSSMELMIERYKGKVCSQETA